MPWKRSNRDAQNRPGDPHAVPRYFDKVNAGLKEKFPRLFRRRTCYLELTAKMARPPACPSWRVRRGSAQHHPASLGRREGADRRRVGIRDIRFESGAFCLLDEVDAPLDENNVGRFCDIVRDMSRNVQFIFITHKQEHHGAGGRNWWA